MLGIRYKVLSENWFKIATVQILYPCYSSIKPHPAANQISEIIGCGVQRVGTLPLGFWYQKVVKMSTEKLGETSEN